MAKSTPHHPVIGHNRPGSFERSRVLARMVVLAVSLLPTGVFLSVALRRIGYPYELEWLEGGAVEIVKRIAAGHSMYAQPTLHYVPYPYTPLYFWVSAALSHVTGVGFLPLRLVSLMSVMGCCIALIAIVWRETGDLVAGVLASGLFTATFAVSGAWLDIGRVDSFALMLVLLTFYVARRIESVTGGVVLGVLVFLAFMAKQSDLIAVAPVVAWLLVTRRRVGVTGAMTAAVLVVSSTVILNATTHDWYGYYVFTELTHQGVMSSVWSTFFTVDLWHVPWAIGLALFGWGVNRYRGVLNSAGWTFWSLAVVGLVGSSFVSRLHSGGGQDTLIPAFAGVALWSALAFAVISRGTTSPGDQVGEARWRPALVSSCLAVVAAVQIIALHYPPGKFVPTSADQAAGRGFIDLLRRTPGPVIVVSHPYYGTMAGKGSWAQGEAVHDILRAGPSRARRDLTGSINAFLTASTSVTIFSDSRHYALGAYSDPYFRLTSTEVFTCAYCFYPVTDLKRRPSFRFVRRSNAANGSSIQLGEPAP